MKLTIPMKLPSCANLREHWSKRARRARLHRQVGCALLEKLVLPLKDDQTATITLTRVAPRPLDSDNVASAFKAFRDGVADALGVDDGSVRLLWQYGQEKGAAAVRVEIDVR